MTSAGAARQSFYFQFVTTPTSDTPGTTLILHFNSQRYVFGQVGEGTQRAFIERGVGIRKVQNVFLTGLAGHHGGLMGMLLTMATAHAESQLRSEHSSERARFNIHGPPRIAHTLASARRFIFRTGMPMAVHEYGVLEQQRTQSEPTWTDENIQVWALPAAEVHDSTAEYVSEENGSSSISHTKSEAPIPAPNEMTEQQAARHSIIQDMFDSDWRHDKLVESDFRDVQLPAKIHIRNPTTKALESFNCATMSDAPGISPNTKVLVRQPWPGSRWEGLPDVDNLPIKAVSYIVRGYAQRGAFEKSKALALGLKPGPRYRQLTGGESVQTDDGQIITPDMVLGPIKPGRGIAIIDLPSPEFVLGLLNRAEWSNPQIMEGIETFCWIVEDSVLEDPRVQDFIHSRSDIQHIFASASSCPNYLAMESSAASAIRLSRISRDHFPTPFHDNSIGIKTSTRISQTTLASIMGPSGRSAQRGLTILIEPRYQIQEQDVVPFLNTHMVLQNIPRAVLKLASKSIQAAVDVSSVTEEILPDHDPEIVCLGTGSAVPSKYRNVSATLLKMPGYGYYLFDCGENTLGQLQRVYNDNALKGVLENVRMIWISHLHADHHLGLLSLLERVRLAQVDVQPKPPLALVAEEAIIDFVRDIDGSRKRLSTADSIHYLVCQSRQPIQQKLPDGQLRGLDDDYLSKVLKIRGLQSSWVSHCFGAQAVSIEFMNGFKISYSGDCRPSKNFAYIGRDSDVLVHEATFEDGLEGDAIAKKHSTTSEALAVAAEMRAKNVILTHFSQRYQKIPVMTHIKPLAEIEFEEGAEETGPSGPVDGDTMPVADELTEEERTLRTRATPVEETAPPNLAGQMNVCIAFDLMRTRVSQIKDMHRLYPAIEALFESQINIDPEATAEDRAEAVNRSKGAQKRESKGEKRKSVSDGNVQGEQDQISKGTLRRKERKQQHLKDLGVAGVLVAEGNGRVEGMSRDGDVEAMETLSPVINVIAMPDTAGSRHLDLLFDERREGLGPIVDVMAQVGGAAEGGVDKEREI